MNLQKITNDQAQQIVKAADRTLDFVSMEPAAGSFTNHARILTCRTATGERERLVAKFLTDKPHLAPKIAHVSYHAAQIARDHGIPVPEPLFLDESGHVLGVPGVVSRFVQGTQVTNPADPHKWAEDLAHQLHQIHSIHPKEIEKLHLFDGNFQTLYFQRGNYPKLLANHPLASKIFDAVRELEPTLTTVPLVLVHLDYWHGNILWHRGRISAVVDWDFAGYGDPAIDVAFFRLNMYLRGIKPMADHFLWAYEAKSGSTLKNLGFRELAAAAQGLPDPTIFAPANTGMGSGPLTEERVIAGYEEFVVGALQRAYAGQ